MSPACGPSLVVYKARGAVNGTFLLNVGRVVMALVASTIDIIVFQFQVP